MNSIKLETRRNLFHLFVGLFIASMIYYLPREDTIGILGGLLFVGLIISKQIHAGQKLPIFTKSLNIFERKDVKFPGLGVITFLTGSITTILLFNDRIAFIAILILAVNDSLSTLVGMRFGTHKIYRNKTIEGFAGGLLSSFVIVLPLIGFINAFIVCLVASIIELFSVLDDNLLIPIFAGAILSVLI